MGEQTREQADGQLRILIERYSQDKVDIEGVILDYIGRTGESLFHVFELNPKIYSDLFAGERAEEGRHLLKCLPGSPDEAEFLLDKCTLKYPLVCDLLREAGVTQTPIETERESKELAINPTAFLHHPIDTVVWHLSDIHFGKFNKLEPDPRQLAFKIAKISLDFPRFRPNIIVVSGDTTSIAAPEEFASFCEFCEKLGVALWQTHHPERLLVVPGNHDITWKDDGMADGMMNFRAHVADKGVCITPFGPSRDTFDDERVLVERHDPAPFSVPPFARVSFTQHRLEFILMVSGYFSGVVPEQVRNLILDSTGTREELRNLLRIDDGAVNQEYLFNLAKLGRGNGFARIGVIHHNPVQYGTETCANTLAPQMLATLDGQSVQLLLHGHVHLTEDPGTVRPPQKGQAYPLPCTTLASECIAGGKGMLIHLISEDSSEVRLDSVSWQLSPMSAFTSGGIRLAYRICLRDGAVSVVPG